MVWFCVNVLAPSSLKLKANIKIAKHVLLDLKPLALGTGDFKLD